MPENLDPQQENQLTDQLAGMDQPVTLNVEREDGTRGTDEMRDLISYLISLAPSDKLNLVEKNASVEAPQLSLARRDSRSLTRLPLVFTGPPTGHMLLRLINAILVLSTTVRHQVDKAAAQLIQEISAPTEAEIFVTPT